VLLHTGAFRTRTLLGRGTFAWVRLGTRFTGGFKPFWTEAAIQPHLYAYTQVRLLQGDAFAHKCSYTGPSHRDGLKKEMILQRDASTRRCSYTEILSTQMSLHTGAWGGKFFYTETVLQRESFRRRHVYTQVALNRYAFTHTRLYALIRLRSAVTYKFFCAEILLSASTFTQTYFDTHWQVFYTQILLHGDVF